MEERYGGKEKEKKLMKRMSEKKGRAEGGKRKKGDSKKWKEK